MTDWKMGFHRQGWKVRKHWGKTVTLDSGWKVRMEFWFNRCDDGVTVVDISLIAYKGMYIHHWAWRKEGVAAGPGGLKVYPVALTLLSEVEQVSLAKAKTRMVVLYVYGATLPLYMIYRSVLRKRGYDETVERSDELAPELRKVLR